MTKIDNLVNIDETLNYLYDKLNWPISQDSPAIDPYDVNWEYYPEDLGLKDSDFAKITTLQQMKPLKDNQDWAVFFVEFDAKKMQITVLRKILGALIFNKRNSDHKIWDKENLLFICYWGPKTNRTIGFIHFNQSVKGLPTLKALYFAPNEESKEKLTQYETYLSHLNWEYCEKCDAWTTEWKKAFTNEYGQVIRDTTRLTKELAHSAQTIRKQILEVLEIENENGYVHKLLNKFKENLVHDMDEKSFADMYAQTICYGLFSARCLNADEEIFDPIKAINNIPDTNPFLRQLLKEGLDDQKGNVKNSISFDELELNSIIELLQNTDIKSIVAEFNRQTRNGYEDPVIHFYEDFLTEYDKETKMDRGVFYTPLPVVNFIVRSVDQILKNEFGITDGLACDEKIDVGTKRKPEVVDRVQILDPATGTGTFLRQTILQIKQNFDAKHNNLSDEKRIEEWNKYVVFSLLNRIYGFELMMAPYAVAHMKLAMALKDTGYNFNSNSRLKVFLTNSLEEPGDSTGIQYLPGMGPDAIAVEATQANRVKKDARINVVIGNPPYSVSSNNKNDWIVNLIEEYKKNLNERNIQPLSDDYIKFIRLGHNYIENNGSGILAYISNNSFIDGLIHRQMRKTLLEDFDKIYILDLHGNSKKKETCPDGSPDKNVFNIQQGVSINIFIKTNKKDKKKLGEIYHSELYGSRDVKFNQLASNSFSSINWEKLIPEDPDYFFVPKNFTGSNIYETGISINELFDNSTSGVKTHHDSELVSFIPFSTKTNNKYYYRPFDTRYIDYDVSKVVRHRYDVMKHMLVQNLSLLTCRQQTTFDFQHVLITDTLSDICSVSLQTGESTYVYPLYKYDSSYKTYEANLNLKILSKIEKTLTLKFNSNPIFDFNYEDSFSAKTFNSLNVLDYIYAVLHTPSYRTKYKEFLKIDFPRIPYPKDKEKFFALAKVGAELRELHLMKSSVMEQTTVTFSGNKSGSEEVTTRKFEDGKVWINKTEYFDNVPETTWNFFIGGYQVADKYLKDRKGRKLSAEEITHYTHIIKILIETDRLMKQLDTMWEV